MDDFTSSLVQKFNFKPKYIRKQKYMYICNTDKGIKVIRPVMYTPDKILFVDNVKNHLLNQGFYNIEKYYKSFDNMPYVINEDIIYVMTDYIDIEESDFSDKNYIIKALQLIATFHKLSQGLKDYNVCQNDCLDIKSNFSKQLLLFEKMKKRVSKQKNLTDFEILFIKNFDYFYKNAILSMDLIHSFNFDTINNLAKKNTMFCHNKIKEETILVGDKSYITQLENITIDHFIYDLYSFILRYIRKHSEDYLTLEQILNIYSKIHYIQPNILPLLYALLNFPARYIDICQSFFERKRTFTPISITSDINQILNLKEFHENYISNIKIK